MSILPCSPNGAGKQFYMTEDEHKEDEEEKEMEVDVHGI